MPETIRAQRIELVDENDHVCGIIGAIKGYASMYLGSHEGYGGITLFQDTDGSSTISMADADGCCRLALEIDPDGMASVLLHDKVYSKALSIGMDPDGNWKQTFQHWVKDKGFVPFAKKEGSMRFLVGKDSAYQSERESRS